MPFKVEIEKYLEIQQRRKGLFEKDSTKSNFFSGGLTSKKETTCSCKIGIHHKAVGTLPRHLSSRQTALLRQGMATADGSGNGGGVTLAAGGCCGLSWVLHPWSVMLTCSP